MDSETGVIRLVTSGVPAIEEQRQQWRRALEDPRAAWPVRLIDDRRAIEKVSDPTDVLRGRKEIEGWVDLIRGGRIAFVAGKAVTYGMARMFEAYIDELPFEVRAFYDLAAAEAWLTGT